MVLVIIQAYAVHPLEPGWLLMIEVPTLTCSPPLPMKSPGGVMGRNDGP